MDRYLTEDRRRKPEGEHLDQVVKVRFTEAEYEELKAAASMQTGGSMATYVHDLAMESLEKNRRRHAQLLADLAEGKPLSEESRQAATLMLKRMAEIGIMRSLHQQLAI